MPGEASSARSFLKAELKANASMHSSDVWDVDAGC
jgi:hypothetical protein